MEKNLKVGGVTIRRRDGGNMIPLLDHYRHDLTEDEEATLCGVSIFEDGALNLLIGCNCGSGLCHMKVTCPACLSVKNGRMN